MSFQISQRDHNIFVGKSQLSRFKQNIFMKLFRLTSRGKKKRQHAVIWREFLLHTQPKCYLSLKQSKGSALEMLLLYFAAT